MSETEVVVFPSPAFVGVIAVTQISFPSAVSRSRSRTRRSIFALVRPYGSTSSGTKPAAAAISSIGRRTAACAISRLDGISRPHQADPNAAGYPRASATCAAAASARPR